jgi:hypothetical protein
MKLAKDPQNLFEDCYAPECDQIAVYLRGCVAPGDITLEELIRNGTVNPMQYALLLRWTEYNTDTCANETRRKRVHVLPPVIRATAEPNPPGTGPYKFNARWAFPFAKEDHALLHRWAPQLTMARHLFISGRLDYVYQAWDSYGAKLYYTRDRITANVFNRVAKELSAMNGLYVMCLEGVID